MKTYTYYWLEHFLKTATVVGSLPAGWCVYREAVDFEE